MRHLILRVSCALIAAGWCWWMGAGLWEARTIPPPLHLVWNLPGAAQWIQFTPDNRQIVWYDSEQFRVSRADRPDPHFLLEQPITPDTPRPMISDNSKFMVLCFNQKVVRCDLETAACQDVFALPRNLDPYAEWVALFGWRPRGWVYPGRPGLGGWRSSLPRLMDVSSDGRRALVWMLDPMPTLIVVDMERRTEILRLAHRSPLTASFSDRGDQILTDGGFGLAAWDAVTGAGEPIPAGWFDADVRLWVLSQDRRSIALLGDEGTVRFVDPAGEEPLPPVRVAMTRPLGGDWDPQRRTLRLHGEQSTPSTMPIPVDVLFDLDSGRRMNFGDQSVLLASGGPGEYVALRYDPTGRNRLVFGRLAQQKEWTIPGRRNFGAGASFSPDGRRIAVGSGLGVSIYDIERK